MFSIEFLNSEVFAWVILPILIFVARIFDQSIGTLRLIFVSKGNRSLAPILGFFEVIIWLLAVSQIMKHLDNVLCYIAYGGGFAMGNYLGLYIEQKLSIGNVIIRVIPKKDTSELINHLRIANFGITVVDAEGSAGHVKMIFSIIHRKDLAQFVSIINEHNPNAFYSIEDVKEVKEGVFKQKSNRTIGYLNNFIRKSK